MANSGRKEAALSKMEFSPDTGRASAYGQHNRQQPRPPRDEEEGEEEDFEDIMKRMVGTDTLTNFKNMQLLEEQRYQHNPAAASSNS